MRSRLLLALAAAAALATVVTAAPSGAVAAPGTAAHGIAAPGIPPAIPGTSSNFQLVGKNPLLHRGLAGSPDRRQTAGSAPPTAAMRRAGSTDTAHDHGSD